MTTQELKQQIDKVLGNSIRCLLPSYWWKRLFNQVADRIDEVEQTTSKLIDSKVEEVKMPIVESVDELNALSVENGTIAKVVSGDRIVGSFNSLAVGDRVDDVEFMQPPYAFGSCSVMFKDKDGNYIGFGVDSNGIECQFGLVTRDVGTIIFGNEKGINQDLYNQAMTIFKEKECTFEWVEGELPVDSFVRPVTKTPIVSNAYIKGETWTRLLKEGDAAGLEVRELYIIGDDVVTGNVSEEYTAEQLAHNKETVDLYKQGKVSLVMNAIIKTLNLDISCTPLNYINTDNGTVICYEVNAIIARAMILVNVDNTGNAQLFSDDISSGSITIDSELSDTSENPVQNKAIKAYVDEKMANGGGLEIREFYIGDSLTDEQKAWNLETAMMVEEKKCTTIFKVTAPIDILPDGTTIPLSAFVDRTFLYVFSSGVNAAFVSITIDSNGNSDITVESVFADTAMSSTSTNAVQNKVVTAALNEKADKSDIKTLNGVSLLGGGNLQLGDGQTIVYDDSAVYGRIAEVEELAAQAKVSSELAIEELNIHLEEVNEGLFEQVSQLMKDLDDLAERVRALENK